VDKVVGLNGDGLRAYHLDRFESDTAGDARRQCETTTGRRFRPIGTWGQDGWDLGAWPNIVFFVADDRPPFDLAVFVEGTVDHYRFPSRDLLHEAIDYLFAWYAVHLGQSWAVGWDPEQRATVPPEFSGPPTI
jgi:hypothetical protein